MNMVDKVVNEKYYKKTDTEVVDLATFNFFFLHSSIFFIFLFT